MPIEWHPISGCSAASIGCANCYAMKQDRAGRDGLVRHGSRGAFWNGEVRFNAAAMAEPAAVLAPSEFYVCPHGDLFHERVPEAWIDRVFAEMEARDRHRYQVLSKRAGRMAAYVAARYCGVPAPAHIFLGASVERCIEADLRVPALICTPAQSRFITVFPMLEYVHLRPWLRRGVISFVTAGEEPERPIVPEWADRLRADCAEAGVPYYFGQRLGA